MGNAVMKDDTEFRNCSEKTDSKLKASLDTKNEAVGDCPNFSLYQTEDALSLTDSTTASGTEYETASNRLSFSTDTSSDISSIDCLAINTLSQGSSSNNEVQPMIGSQYENNLTYDQNYSEESDYGKEETNYDDCFFSLTISNSEFGLDSVRSSRKNKLCKGLEFLKIRRKSHQSRSEKFSKSEARKIFTVYKNFFSTNHVKKKISSANNLECFTHSLLDDGKFDAFTNCDETQVSNFETIHVNPVITWRILHPAYFRFNYRTVLVRKENDICMLDESTVRNLFSKHGLYLLQGIEFALTPYLQDLWYVAEIIENFQIEPTEDKTNRGNCMISPSLIEIHSNIPGYLSIFKCETAHVQISNRADKMNGLNNGNESGSDGLSVNIDSQNNIAFHSDDLEYIANLGGSGLVAENLRKQSLYMKFDPLVANESNMSLNGNTTFPIDDLADLSLNDGNDTLRAPFDNSSMNSTFEVTDAGNMEHDPVSKLISVTPSKSPRKKKSKSIGQNEKVDMQNVITPKTSPRLADTDSDDISELKSLLMKQMKREEAFKEEIENLRRENEQISLRFQNSEKEIVRLRQMVEACQENEKKLKNELAERIKSKQQLSMVMEEYEKTISQMVSRKESDKAEFDAAVKKIETERDSAIQHLNNLENAFNDVHQKYERGKTANEALKRNEDILKKCLSEYENTVKNVENKYELLKSHATSQLEKANEELEQITQTHEKEQAKLKAMLRKSEIQINSLKNALDQKTKENQELTAVCDELIVKLSNHSSS